MMDFNTMKEMWQNGELTDYGVYQQCKTDLDFYNLLGSEGYSEEAIKEVMCNVSGADDAYYNALDMAEYYEERE